jgi:hypothetical protein
VGAGWRAFLGLGLFEVVAEFLVLVSIVDREFEFSFFGPEDDGLAFHAADHVEGRFGFSAQSHFQQVFFNAGFNGLAQLRGDFKEAVRRTKSFDALMRPLVIVILDPEPDALARRIEALELSAGEELLPDGFPEALDFAQRHGMMRPGFEVVRAVLFHFRLETSHAAPVDILPAIIREHLFGWLIFRCRDAKHFQDVLGRVAAEQIGSHDKTRVVIHEADHVGIAAPEPEGEDVGLPHLVGCGSLKETRPDQIAPRPGRGFN